jgi:hypothetical protein
MLCFWVLSMCHRDGVPVNSVYVNIKTLHDYWGHMLVNHNDIQGCEISQQYISSDRLTDSQETLIEVEIFDKQKDQWVRHYFMDARDVVAWQVYHEDNAYDSLEFSTMMLKTMHINRD